MPGPIPMALGPWRFAADGAGFDGVDATLDASWASLAVAERLDALQFTGPKHETLVIRGVTFPVALQDDGAALAGLQRAARQGETLILVTAAGAVLGKFAIMSLKRQQSFFTAQGAPQKVAYALTLRRYEAPAAPPHF